MAYRGFREASLRFANVCISTAKGKRVSGVSVLNQRPRSFIYLFFPLYVHRYLDDSGEEPTPEPISLQEAEPEDIWEMMFRLLTPEQRKQVTGRFKGERDESGLSLSV
ncbi:Putative bacteriophage protein [Salmonella enterica subsp. enterica serovar Typhimurium]|nr:Putative bacteriophage protein [Salmonella enterica subsp. enterica serovar Typhimurium]